MKGQEFDICDLPFDGYYAPQVETKRRPWGCPLSRHHEGKPGFGPFGRPGFDHGPESHGHHHGPHHHRPGPPEDGHRRHGCGRWGPPQRDADGPGGVLFHGPPPGFGPGHDGRPHDFHGHRPSSHNFGPQPWWFGRRGPSDAERPWTGTGPWGGPDQRS